MIRCIQKQTENFLAQTKESNHPVMRMIIVLGKAWLDFYWNEHSYESGYFVRYNGTLVNMSTWFKIHNFSQISLYACWMNAEYLRRKRTR